MATAEETKTKQPEGVDAVALKALSYRWHLDRQDDPARWNYQFAERGTRIKLRPEELDRLVSLGAVTTDADSPEAKLALAGRPAPSGPIGTTVIPSETAQVRAIQTVATVGGSVGPHSTEYEMLTLDLPTLRLYAKAFGVEASEDDSPQDLARKLTARAEDVEAITQHRDQVQLAARETGTEEGRLATAALAGGRDALTGLPLDTSEDRTVDADEPKRTRGSRSTNKD